MTPDTRVRAVPPITTTPLFDITVDLEPPLKFGPGPLGRRTLYPASRGTFHGPRLRGEVLPGGGDWALYRADGTMSLDVRLTLRTDDDHLIHMTYGGRWVIPPDVRADLADTATRHHIDPARYYFRTTPLFETGSPKYGWLNDIVCVGSGYLIENGIAYHVAQLT
ncbi:DUF3237 domain-containing protein [Nocardia sp. NPDC003482]